MGRFISNRTRESLKPLAWASSMGFAMALAIALGIIAGHMVDRYFGTSPYGFLIGLLMGIVAAFRNLFIMYKRTQKKQAKTGNEQDSQNEPR